MEVNIATSDMVITQALDIFVSATKETEGGTLWQLP